MVAVIHTSHSLHMALNYNEQKTKQGKANCIMAINYPKDIDKLNFYQKLNRLTRQAALNENTKRNSVHISLNFDPSEKLDKEKLEAITIEYMDKIGFGKQPYLVYEHHDAGHPHLHIVTTNIEQKGKRIELHNLGRNQSQKARKEIEIKYNLIKADDKKSKLAAEVKPITSSKILYGKSETKRAITNVLDAVISQYKYTSLAELNAVLKLYNVIADRGSEDSRIYQKNGLVFRILDEKGNKIGVPIKASSIYSKPTLANLEKRFPVNEQARKAFKKHITTSIDWALTGKNKPSLEALIKAVEKERIQIILRQNNQNIIYGITYVDHQTKCVFNGSDLGKQYCAKGLMERCDISLAQGQNGMNLKEHLKVNDNNILKENIQLNLESNNILDSIIMPVDDFNYLPWQLKKRKKRKHIHHK